MNVSGHSHSAPPGDHRVSTAFSSNHCDDISNLSQSVPSNSGTNRVCWIHRNSDLWLILSLFLVIGSLKSCFESRRFIQSFCLDTSSFGMLIFEENKAIYQVQANLFYCIRIFSTICGIKIMPSLSTEYVSAFLQN